MCAVTLAKVKKMEESFSEKNLYNVAFRLKNSSLNVEVMKFSFIQHIPLNISAISIIK